MNEMMPENLALASAGQAPSHAELLAILAPCAALAEPGRPLIAPCDNYFFRCDANELKGFEKGSLKGFPFQGKFPVLFVDGHVEDASTSEYEKGKLCLVPITQIP